MRKGRRLYQAIVNRCLDEGMSIDKALMKCLIDPAKMNLSLESDPDEIPPEIEDVVSREAIEACAAFLDVSVIRVMLLLDIFSIGDINGYSFLSRSSAMAVASYYLDTLSSTNLFGKSELLLQELVASTMSRTLEETCEKIGIPEQVMRKWKETGRAEMSDHLSIKEAAKVCGMSKPAVMACLNLLKKEDFTSKGRQIKVIDELEKALSVEVW